MNSDWQQRLTRVHFQKRRWQGPANPRAERSAIDVTSRAQGWLRAFSPFVAGPVQVPEFGQALRMENAWQFSKVYREHLGPDGWPNAQWYEWARSGFMDGRAHRYPKGRGAKPEYLYWGGSRLDYIEAKKQVYLPLYRDAIREKRVFQQLSERVGQGESIEIFDFDVYDLDTNAMTFHQTLHRSDVPTGHGFVLGMMLVYGADVTADYVARYHDAEATVRQQTLAPDQNDLFRP